MISVGKNLRVSELAQKVAKLTVSVLPDFFFDRIVSVPSIQQLYSRIREKAKAGGGNVRGYLQTEIRGGNATNLAAALAALNVRVRLFCIGDNRVRSMLASLPKNCELNLISGRPGYTVALEFRHRGRVVNVMVCDDGDLCNFDGRELRHRDLLDIKKSDLIALVNWSANLKGNQLARRVFMLTGRAGRLNFIDPADLAKTESRIASLVEMITRENLVDVVSLNENEARILTIALSLPKLPRTYNSRNVLRTANLLHDELQVTVDLHTPIGSASAHRDLSAWEKIPGRPVPFATGAGDVWDAGDIVGHLANLEIQERLRFANATAFLYLKSGRLILPNIEDVARFLK